MNVSYHKSMHPVLDLPLTEVLRPEIALPMQQLLKIYTVGSFLKAWDNPTHQPHIAHLFESTEQAHHAIALCATWAGYSHAAVPSGTQQWMRAD
jgi:hypothetical protein